MFNYKLIIEYDGLKYFGWQKQKYTKNTLQEELETALKTLLKTEVKVTAAGRTDTKVSAYNQTVNFFSEKNLDLKKFRHSLNALLSENVSVKKISKVNNEFHSRYSAKSREYIYRITTDKKSINKDYYYKINYMPDLRKIDDFIKFILRRKNFRSLCKNIEDRNGFKCEIHEFKYKFIKSKNEMIFTISANRFLHSMIRALLGCTLDISRGKEDPKRIKELIKKGEKFKIHFLPANALFLNKISY